MKILIIGPQGSGKSTQSKLLAKYLDIPFIETGEIFRNIAKENSDLGKIVKDLLERGEMMPDDITADIVEDRINEGDSDFGFVMNGYPRSLNQIKLFDPMFDIVFYLKISDEEVIKRLIKRGREDDTMELIRKRLADYYRLTEPILGFYENLEILEEIDGNGTIEEIQQTLRRKTDDKAKE